MARALLLSMAVLVGGCSAPPADTFPAEPLSLPPAPKGCPTPLGASAADLVGCDLGAGDFGYWSIGPSGLPAYEYRLDQHTDPRAAYRHSVAGESTDHFHVVGNARVNAIVHNGGYVELVGQERGPSYTNRFDPGRGQIAGGFSYIAEGDHVWCSAYDYRPEGAQTRRSLGMGRTVQVTQHQGLRVTHQLSAPPGDDPLLLDEVTLENLLPVERQLRHYEAWDVNRRQLMFELVRYGSMATVGDRARMALNEAFQLEVERLGDVVRVTHTPLDAAAQPGPDEVSAVDAHPAPIFLAALGRDPTDVYTDGAAFLGQGGLAQPDAVRSGRAGELLSSRPAGEQQAALVMRHDLVLPPLGRVQLRFAYGYQPAGFDLSQLEQYREPRDPREHGQRWSERLAYFSSPAAPELGREVPWHAYYLLGNAGHLDYFDTTVTPQGSAYLYLHGFDGAPRDLSLFSLALTYLDPARARANLRLIMAMTRAADGEMSYSYHGNGVLEGAAIHAHPSDLDLFFMVALHEYLAATGHWGYLAEAVPFHPRGAAPPPPATGYTVLDHLRVAVQHLIDTVGVGPNGLVRLSDGDWSDGIVWTTSKADPSHTIASGESIPNTQMAVYVLPELAQMIEPFDGELAARMRAHAQALRGPLLAQYDGKWFLRAWLRDSKDQPFAKGAGSLDLEAQPWALIDDDLLSPQQQQALADRVDEASDSPLGPKFSYGSVWPAVGQLVTWAYTRHRPQRAWTTLLKQSLARRAQLHPDVWFDIWSGPDGVYASSGETWRSQATPMTDWPVANMNLHAMFLLGLVRVAGVEPWGASLRLRPTTTPQRYQLRTPLLQLSVEPGRLDGSYHAQVDGQLTLVLAAPAGKTLTEARVGQELRLPRPGAAPRFTVRLQRGRSVELSMRWQ